jgi:hypothetical protein
MDAIWGLISFLGFVIGWAIWIIISGLLPGFRMKSLHRQAPAVPASRQDQPRSQPVPLAVLPPVTVTYTPAPFILRTATPSSPASPPPASPAPPTPAARPSPVPSSPVPSSPATGRRTFRITSNPAQNSPGPIPANVSAPPARPDGRRTRMRTKGPVSAPGRCKVCHTEGRVLSAGAGKWHCLECDEEW